jgi:hypothetical protein
LHVEELHKMYSSPNMITIIKSRRMKWAGNVSSIGKERNAYRILVGKPEGKRPLGRPRRSWDGNIKMDLGEIECDGMERNDLAQDSYQWRALVNTVMNFFGARSSKKF